MEHSLANIARCCEWAGCVSRCQYAACFGGLISWQVVENMSGCLVVYKHGACRQVVVSP